VCVGGAEFGTKVAALLQEREYAYILTKGRNMWFAHVSLYASGSEGGGGALYASGSEGGGGAPRGCKSFCNKKNGSWAMKCKWYNCADCPQCNKTQVLTTGSLPATALPPL
jgi:hypothetical protein